MPSSVIKIVRAGTGLVAQVFASALARKRAALELREYSEFERLLTDLSSAFVAIEPSAVDAEIERWLRRLAAYLGMDRSSVVQLSPDGRVLQVTHSYAIEGLPPVPKIVLDTDYPWYVERIREGRTLRFERLPDDLPPEAVAEHAFVATAGFKSNLMLPISVANVILGALTFGMFRTYRAWPDPLVNRLHLVAEVIGQALARSRGQRELEERLAFERLITDMVKMFVTARGDELDARIHEALGRLVEHLGLDRASLARLTPDGEGIAITHWFARSGVRPPPLTVVRYTWYLEALRRGPMVELYSTRNMPAEMAATGLKAHLSIPLQVGGAVWGAIGLGLLQKEREWSAVERQRLGLVGEIIVQALLRRESEEAMRRQQGELAHVARVAALGELTAALAHELNQPLAAIGANAQATRRVLAAGKTLEDLDEILGDISADAARAADLIGGLRALLQRRELKRATLDLNQILRDIEAIAQTEVRRHDAELLLALTDGLPPVLGDAVQLQQVVLNLLRNAAEAMVGDRADARKVVMRSAVSPQDRVTVSVEDDGPPIDDAAFARLFTTFNTTKPEGLGMGLAISRRIVEAHGGYLWAERRPGRGLTMRFALPGGDGARPSGGSSSSWAMPPRAGSADPADQLDRPRRSDVAQSGRVPRVSAPTPT